jgi:hypothetical protein
MGSLLARRRALAACCSNADSLRSTLLQRRAV